MLGVRFNKHQEDLELFKSKNIYKVALIIGYIALFLPFIYAVFYSMPANDDFPLRLNWWGGNIITEGFKRLQWNYMNWFGQSGVIAILIQVWLNPLYWFDNQGHSFGIFMVIVFSLIVSGTLWGARRLFIAISNCSNKIADIFTFLLALLLFTSYYYNDVYSWWSGVPGYSFMLMISCMAYGRIVQYLNDHRPKDYIMMIILGTVACTSMMNCVATGLFYILFVFFINGKDGDTLKKKIIPLICYVVSGIITVAAPGNFKRIEFERFFGHEVKDPQYISSAIVTIERVVIRLIKTMVYKPWTIAIVVALLVLGMSQKSERTPKFKHIIIASVFVVIAAFGAVYPYVLGSNKTFESEFANRIYFVEDYIMFIGASLIAFRFGQWLAFKCNKYLSKKIVLGLFAGIFVLTFIGQKISPYTTEFVPVDIVKRASLIKESHYFWGGILEEVKNSDEDIVEIYRDEIDWCPYVYGCGLSSESIKWPDREDVYYCWCNEAVAKYYGKKDVLLHYYSD